MKRSVFWALFLTGLSVVAVSCGRDQSDQDAFGRTDINGQEYPQLAQYGQYQNYDGQQVWIPNEQPPESWIPGESYYQQGMAYMPPYYGYLNQPQCWRYDRGIGWSYRRR